MGRWWVFWAVVGAWGCGGDGDATSDSDADTDADSDGDADCAEPDPPLTQAEQALVDLPADWFYKHTAGLCRP